ncbi:Golgin family A protein [Melia azedarach]|uniref:Golgin family A protein n=1 Tax=Melia azedarach TaxID=155640 RepID=A0ACC1YQ76_MELAZ|nr:Golgin family A protein [Melia azedarach]
MEGVGSRLGRASARYGPTQTVFSGPVRKWKKKWVHVSSSSSSTVSQSNGHNSSNSNGSPLLLCKWTPLSPNPSDNNGATPEEPPKRRFRYTPIAVLQEQKKAFSEKDEDEARESETIMFTAQPNSETNELNIDEALTKETQEDSNVTHWDLDLCLKGQSGDHESVGRSKEDLLIKSAIDDLF